ncbi:MAG: hypothetical protein ACRCT8_12985 [Lacipirellulaceae bacterium]
MTFDLPQETFDKLNAHAVAAGYTSTAAFLAALADEPTADPSEGLPASELRASAAECDQTLAQMKAGSGRDLRESLAQLGARRGFPLSE